MANQQRSVEQKKKTILKLFIYIRFIHTEAKNAYSLSPIIVCVIFSSSFSLDKFTRSEWRK